MASYTIHIAIAKEYIKKHKGYDEEEFIKGTISPDLVKDKKVTHFAETSQKSDLNEFLKYYSIENSYYAGWFLHLIVDREFFTKYLNDWDSKKDTNAENLYEDYNIMNKEIIEKYNIKFPKIIEEYSIYKEGKLTYINRQTILNFINEMGEINIEDYIIKK